jgi:hypothetical protein
MTPGVPARLGARGARGRSSLSSRRRAALRGARGLSNLSLLPASRRGPRGAALRAPAPRGAALRGPALLAPAAPLGAALLGAEVLGAEVLVGLSLRVELAAGLAALGAAVLVARAPLGAPFFAFFPKGFLSADLAILLYCVVSHDMNEFAFKYATRKKNHSPPVKGEYGVSREGVAFGCLKITMQ